MTDASQFDEEAGPLADDEYIDDDLAAPDPEPTVEERARAQGWRPGRAGRDGIVLGPQEYLDKGHK